MTVIIGAKREIKGPFFEAKIMRGGRDNKYIFFYIPARFDEKLQAGGYVTVVKTKEGIFVRPRKENVDILSA